MRTEAKTMTNSDLRVMYGALGILGNRSCATAMSDLKVGRLLNALAAIAHPIGTARQRVSDEFTNGKDPDKMSAPALQIMAAQMASAIAEFDAAEEEFEIPTMRITPDDLPKEKPGDDGWKNGAQIGAISADLGVLFEWPDDEECKQER